MGLEYETDLGALLTFVFGAPAVIVHSLKGSLASFVVMQLVGVSAFTLAANNSQRLVEAIGVEKAIALGSWLAAAGSLLMLLFSFVTEVEPWQLLPLSIPLCVGLGLRGPPGPEMSGRVRVSPERHKIHSKETPSLLASMRIRSCA